MKTGKSNICHKSLLQTQYNVVIREKSETAVTASLSSHPDYTGLSDTLDRKCKAPFEIIQVILPLKISHQMKRL